MEFNLRQFISKAVLNYPLVFGIGFIFFNLYWRWPIIVKIIDNQLMVQDKNTDYRIFNSRPRRIRRYSQGVKLRCERLLFSYCLEDLYIPDNAIIVDIGANIGEVSYALSKKNSKVKIIAIEPDPEEFKDLLKNVGYSPNIVLNEVISNKTGEIDFYLNNDSGDSSVYFTAGAKIKISKVCTTLDDIYSKYVAGEDVFLSKCDAEGFEPEVLLGGQLMLSKTKYICIDAGPERLGKRTFNEVNKILVELNFQLLKGRKDRYLFVNQTN